MVRKHSHSKKHSAPKHHHAKRAHSASMSAMSPVFAPVSAPMRSGSAGEGRIFWALFTMVAIALIVVIILRLLAKDSTTTSIPRVAATTKAAFEEVKKNKGLIAGLSVGTIVSVLVVGFLIWKYGSSSGLKDRASGALEATARHASRARNGAVDAVRSRLQKRPVHANLEEVDDFNNDDVVQPEHLGGPRCK